MKKTLYSVLDIESTGLSPKNDDRIIEIGVTKIDIDGNIIDTYETLVNPVRKVAATHIHGINDYMVKNAPRFSDIASELLLFLNETVFVAHNVGFDMSFLKSEFGQAGYDISDNPRLCTLILSRKLFPNLPSKKLESLCNHFRIDSGLAHSAYSDAFATSKLFSIIMNRYSYREKLEKPDLVDYMEKYKIQTPKAVHHIKRSDVVNCR